MSDITFGTRLASLMKAADLNQTALAERVGIDRSRVSRLVNDKRPPNSDEVVWLAEALGVTVESMLEGISMPEPVLRDIQRAQELGRKVLEANAARDEAVAQLAALQEEYESREGQHQEVLAAVRKEHRLALDTASQQRLQAEQQLRSEIDGLKDQIHRLSASLHAEGLKVKRYRASAQRSEEKVAELRGQVTDVKRTNGQAALVMGLLGLAGGAALGSSGRNS